MGSVLQSVAVAAAFVENHDSFERKSPQMRHGLAPLLGDGLFISDGDTWRRRRRVVAPIVHVSHLPLFAPLMVQAASETADRWTNSRRCAPEKSSLLSVNTSG